MKEKILPLIEYCADELVIVIAGVVVRKSPAETETDTNYKCLTNYSFF